MAAKTELKLDEAHAEAIVELGIKYGAYSEEMPDTKKDKIAAAEEIIAFTIDAWINDDIRPDDDNAKVAKSGEQIAEIHELAGIEIDEDDEVIYGELPDLDGEDDDDDNGDDGEVPFDPDDYIEGYSEMSVSAKVKAVKALDADDDDDVATMEALVEWENEQEKPSARVLNLIEEAIGEPDDDGDDDDDEPADEDESDEPWEGYDKSSAVEIKKILTQQMEDEENPLTVEQVQYVLDYEQNREKPPPRKRVITFCEELIAEFEDEGGAEPDDDDEPKGGIAGARRGRGRGKKSAAKVAEDNGLVIELTREQILTALDSGTVSIEVA
jgi:hypothetical protein